MSRCISQCETNVLSNVHCRKSYKKEAKVAAVESIYKNNLKEPVFLAGQKIKTKQGKFVVYPLGT